MTTNIMDMPASKPPAGVVPNYDDPENENTMVLGILSFCLAVSTIAVILRAYSRWQVMHKAQPQDYLLAAAYGIYVAIIVLYYRIVDSPGWFVHLWEMRLGGMVEFLHIGIVTTCMFLGFLIAIKTAVMVEWMHLFLPNGGHRNRAFFWACHFVIWANITFCVVTLILVNLSCVPYEYTWNRTLPGGYCRINTAYTSLSAGAFAFATDIIILFIPLRIISKLHISRNRKIGVSFVFALGVAACIASIVRLYYTVGRAESADLTYNLSRVQLTAVGEGTAVILVLCVPTWPSAAAALKSSNIMHSLPSWSNLVSSLRNRSSQNSLGNRAQNGTTSHWQSRHNKNNDVYSKIELGAAGDTIPIRQFGSHQQYDLEPAIIRSTDIQTSEEYIAGHEQHRMQSNSQHGWTHG